MSRKYLIILTQILIVIVTAILLPTFFNTTLVTKWNITISDQIIIGIVVILLIAVAPISALLENLRELVYVLIEQKRRETDEIAMIDRFDAELIALQKLYRNIQSFDRGGVLSSTIESKLIALKHEASHLVSGKYVDVSPALHTTEPLLSSIGPDDGCEFVHYLDNNDYFFGNTHSIDFSRSLDELRRKRLVKYIRRLLIFADKNELSDPFTWLLVAYHEDTMNADYRIISFENFLEMQREAGFGPGRRDFGIYGNRYVYASNQNPNYDDELKGSPYGRFIAAAEQRNQYKRLFDTCWNSQTAFKAPADFGNIVRKVVASKIGGRSAVSRPRVNSIEAMISGARLRPSILEAQREPNVLSGIDCGGSVLVPWREPNIEGA